MVVQGLEEEVRDDDDHGEDDDLAKEARVLNRIVRWHPRKGITYEAVSGHAKMISRDTGARKLKTISTPAAKEAGRDAEEEKRHDLNERRLSGKLGGKINDDSDDYVECR